MLNQEAYQRTMALPVGGNNLAAQNQAVRGKQIADAPKESVTKKCKFGSFAG